MAADRRGDDSFAVAACATRRLVLLGFALALPIRPALGQAIGLSDEIIADPNSGAALFGFDPVAYFLEERAVPGRVQLQTIHAGRVWHFASPANQAAFEADPQPYVPAFGGHDPLGIAAGFAVAGNPQTFAVSDKRLFLFRDDNSRAIFLRDPARLDLAERNWPLVRRDMVP
ncbi:MAG: YHS domain-containing (seleno)protein [Beijerinckiaceae bacterium]|nr:YHS domain-containing (seleno)protein [Beijerinckiaceae bacterium]